MIDPIEQAIDVLRQHWKEDIPVATLSYQEQAKKRAVESQEEHDWLVASIFNYITRDTPKAYIVILWRSLGTGDTVAKIQIKPVLVHWNVDLDEFMIVDITRIE